MNKVLSIFSYILSGISIFIGLLLSMDVAGSDWDSFLRYPDLDYFFEFLFVFFPEFIKYLITASILFAFGTLVRKK